MRRTALYSIATLALILGAGATPSAAQTPQPDVSRATQASTPPDGNGSVATPAYRDGTAMGHLTDADVAAEQRQLMFERTRQAGDAPDDLDKIQEVLRERARQRREVEATRDHVDDDRIRERQRLIMEGMRQAGETPAAQPDRYADLRERLVEALREKAMLTAEVEEARRDAAEAHLTKGMHLKVDAGGNHLEVTCPDGSTPEDCVKAVGGAIQAMRVLPRN